MTHDRRKFLSLAAVAPFAAFTAGRALAEDAACYDPQALPSSQQSLRRSLEFKPVSDDPAKRCELCAFYTAGGPGCGKCQILSGPVAGTSVCASFAPRPK